VVQDTGFAPWPPAGLGVLAFSSPEGAVAALEELAAHPRRHAGAAREIAAAYFESGRVLAALLEEALAAPSRPAVGAGA
jgi:hypothetical protein